MRDLCLLLLWLILHGIYPVIQCQDPESNGTAYSDQYRFDAYDLPSQRNFSEAQTLCERNGGQLAFLYREGSRNAVKSIIEYDNKGKDHKQYWVGATDEAVEDTWIWLNGKNVEDDLWSRGEPNDAGGGENCAITRSDNLNLNDEACGGKQRFVCQEELFTNFTFNDHVYIIHRLEDEWKSAGDAKQACKAEGARLVEIHTDEVNDEIKKRILNEYHVDKLAYGLRQYWTGGGDALTEGDYLWNDKTPFNITDWEGDDPNDGTTGNCVSIMKEGWWDGKCSHQFPFICEQVPANNARVSARAIKVAPGSNNTITCAADGLPTPHVAWYYNNIEVRQDKNLSVYQIQESFKSTLFLENATITNEGSYNCCGINHLNGKRFESSDHAEVTVFIRPKIESITRQPCNSSLTIRWSNAKAPNIKHRVTVKDGAKQAYSKLIKELVTMATGLANDTLYTVEVTPCPNGICRQKDSADGSNRTAGLPGKSRNVTVEKIAEKQCRVNWTEPALDLDEYINGYKIIGEYTIAEKASVNADESPQQSPMSSAGNGTSYTFPGFSNRKYRFGVQAKTCVGYGEVQWSEEYCITDKEAPDVVDKPSVETGLDKKGLANVTLTIPNQDNGPVSCLFVIVRDDSDAPTMNISYSLQELKKANDSSSNSSDYIAIAVAVSGLTNLEETVILGDGTSSSCDVMKVAARRRKRATSSNNTFYVGKNSALNPSRIYSIFTVSTTPVNGEIRLRASELQILQNNTESEGSDVTVIVVIVIAVVLALIILLIVAIVLRRKQNSRIKEPSEVDGAIEMKEGHTEDTVIYENTAAKSLITTTETEIKISELEEVYNGMLKNSGQDFTKEYMKLTIQAQANINSREFGSKPELKKLNRYKNIIPFDSTRVVLKNTNTGYINACHVGSAEHSHRFIATQGPLKTTVNDFWLMIVEQKCAVIVMLAKCVEATKRKCEKYWPEPQSIESYGVTTVTNSEEFNFCGFIRRKLDVKADLKEGHVKQTVYQYHFTNWPDHGVPPTTSHLARMHHEAMMTCEGTDLQRPIVVHCSAGAGRTGTFIGYDILKEEARKRGSVDVYNCVIKMREQRVDMVQNCDQYVLVHKLVLESYLFEDTDYSAAEATQKFGDSNYRSSDIPKQFENLSRVRPMETAAGGSREKMTAYQRMRIRNIETESSIDASYLECYDDSVKLIASAGPTQSSVAEFWKNVYDSNTSVIIALSSDVQYWANEPLIETAYGDIKVTWNKQEDLNEIVKRSLTVAGPHKTLVISQLQLTGDLSAKVAVRIVNEMQKALNESSASVAMVHCRDGLGLTGTFCGIVNLIARLKVENRVDVFRTIKDLRDCRPGMIQTIDQYLTCHDSVTEYLESFDIYSNFQ